VKWQSRLREAGTGISDELIDLEVVRGLAATERKSGILWDKSSFPTVQLPDGADHEAVRIVFNVPPIDPWTMSLNNVDLWYFVTDVLALARLREAGIRTWGQFKDMRERGIGRLIANYDEVSMRAELRARALDVGLDTWRVGRTLRLTRSALAACGLISETFFDTVAETAAQNAWNASALVSALRGKQVSGFREKRIEELEEYFRTNGYMTDANPLESSLVLSSAQAAVADDIDSGILDANEIKVLLLSVSDQTTSDLPNS
jgi:hypothetical protein